MASEPFEVTDDKGNTVTGTVDVFRDANGPYFDPKSEYYMNPRYADAHFDYFNTREACTIDRDVLSRAMQDAFAKALTRFGIENPGRAKIAEDVGASINATRQQCIRNADKYVSNETFSSSNWETGETFGDLTAKAYAEVPAPNGGIQTVVVRENSWPAADVAALKNYGSANAPILSRRVITRDGGSNTENRGSPSEGIAPENPTPQAPPPRVGGLAGISSNTNLMRYLGRRDGGHTASTRIRHRPPGRAVRSSRSTELLRPSHRLGRRSGGPRSAESDASSASAGSGTNARNLQHRAGPIFEPEDCRPTASIRI
ncbi:hypothetical protein [Bradyrhizobium sp. JYMT SZCCT0428]|uniref:hypothetical protein n=1 Tax=Bradyrhizobium sp. JYMT SZCCT0428 TaxID=2807673 RepID=UPI001BA6C77E|nr:hypothetical protein [Bradyrhizobium sp. JYMT SZCCT0428]MBR1152711.1 hypothetical protein [Bradyrhizobium sp. JYMT SZCCT0428]